MLGLWDWFVTRGKLGRRGTDPQTLGPVRDRVAKNRDVAQRRRVDDAEARLKGVRSLVQELAILAAKSTERSKSAAGKPRG